MFYIFFFGKGQKPLRKRNFMESRQRSIAKTLSWRMIATITGGGVVMWQTGQLGDALTFMGIEFPLKMLFYYLHERGWSLLDWGNNPLTI